MMADLDLDNDIDAFLLTAVLAGCAFTDMEIKGFTAGAEAAFSLAHLSPADRQEHFTEMFNDILRTNANLGFQNSFTEGFNAFKEE
jgi:hypothetical protein